jgi:hypothetical protein
MAGNIEKKAALVEWFTIFGSMVGLTCPTDLSDTSLKHFYQALKLVTLAHIGRQIGSIGPHWHGKLAALPPIGPENRSHWASLALCALSAGWREEIFGKIILFVSNSFSSKPQDNV